mmetsp:Transcript_13778/g.19262  ORF Transcript_13778/g.19262 Transcript_13778/m.19262 type:complete len:293 (-) Transcript_13778:138-1016(-)
MTPSTKQAQTSETMSTIEQLEDWKTVVDQLQDEQQKQDEPKKKDLRRGFSLNVYGRRKSSRMGTHPTTAKRRTTHRRRLIGGSINSTTSTESSRSIQNNDNLEGSSSSDSSSSSSFSRLTPFSSIHENGNDGQHALSKKKKRSFFAKSFRKPSFLLPKNNNNHGSGKDFGGGASPRSMMSRTQKETKPKTLKSIDSQLVVREDVYLPKPKQHKKKHSIQGNTTSKGMVVVKIVDGMVPGTLIDVNVPEGTHTIPAIIPENMKEFNVYYTKQASPFVLQTISVLRPGKYGEAQ